ncbi:MAG: hypothetical protein M3R25_10315 [Bacteroidota bacterium]|nr:hypothetical protein [Bacteroidota bacterium]
MKTQTSTSDFTFSLLIRLALVTLIILAARGTDAQTEKGNYSIGFHNYSPTGINIDGLPINLFPQNCGLGFSFGSHKTKLDGSYIDVRENTTTFGFSLSGSQFIFDDFSVGLIGNFYSGSTTYKETEKVDEKYSTFMLMGGAEIKYFLNGGPNLKYWMKASPILGVIQSTYNGQEVHLPKRLYQFSGGTGVSYFPNKHLSIDLGLTYSIFTVRNKGGYTEISRKEYIDSIGMDVGFSFFF